MFRRLKGDLYLMLNGADGNGFRCLGFQVPDAPYPTLITWTTTSVKADEGTCRMVDDDAEALDAANSTVPCKGDEHCGADDTKYCFYERVVMGEWVTDGKGPKDSELDQCTYNDGGIATSCTLGYYCGFEDSEDGAASEKLMSNGGTVWNVKPLGCQGKFCSEKMWDNKWIIRSLARGDKNRDGVVDVLDYDCLYFPSEGAAYTHPRRVPDAASDDGVWLGSGGSADVDANGDLECGIWTDAGVSQETALVDNLQAVWSLIPLPGGMMPAMPVEKKSPLEEVLGLDKYTEWIRDNHH